MLQNTEGAVSSSLAGVAASRAAGDGLLHDVVTTKAVSCVYMLWKEALCKMTAYK